jgi:hypothetical protein
MTARLIPCRVCGRHFRDEPQCPFCGVERAPAPDASLRTVAAAMALVAGLGAAGCGARPQAAVYGGPPPIERRPPRGEEPTVAPSTDAGTSQTEPTPEERPAPEREPAAVYGGPPPERSR